MLVVVGLDCLTSCTAEGSSHCFSPSASRFLDIYTTFDMSCIKGTTRRRADTTHCSFCFDVLIAHLTGLEGPPPDFEDGNWYVCIYLRPSDQALMLLSDHEATACINPGVQSAVCDLDQGWLLGQAQPTAWLHRDAGASQAARSTERLCAHKVCVRSSMARCCS